jgi:two-component system sensor histidine kinase RegB
LGFTLMIDVRTNLDGRAGRTPPDQAFQWLCWLRWSAVAGQSLTVWFVAKVIGIALPLVEVGVVIGLTAVTNAGLYWIPHGWRERPRLLVAILGLDVSMLTVLLHYTGGPHNPFSSFYLVHVALAAVLLPLGWTFFIAGWCCLGYVVLYLENLPLPRLTDVVCGVGEGLPMETHLQGMLVAFVLTSVCVALFANRLRQTLMLREEELAKARSIAQSHEHFAALATMAAGAAHELGTPLGTIAIAAGELVRTAMESGAPSEMLDDAELVREEAFRCRGILDRLQSQADDARRLLGLGEVVEEVLRRYPALQVQWSGAVPGSVLDAPREALIQALSSLVKNALDASRPGSPVGMRVGLVGAWTEFRVEDRGVGLGQEAALHAGEPFFTTKAPNQGMGLGLFLVRLLAQRLDGEFRIEPRKGGGTLAVLRLPNRRTQ